MNRSITANTQVGAVPEIASPKYVDFLERYDTFCAAHGGQQLAFWNLTIEKTRIASSAISIGEEFAAFYTEVGLSRSTVSKYRHPTTDCRRQNQL